MHNIISNYQIIRAGLITLFNRIVLEIKLLERNDVAPTSKLFSGLFKESRRNVCEIIVGKIGGACSSTTECLLYRLRSTTGARAYLKDVQVRILDSKKLDVSRRLLVGLMERLPCPVIPLKAVLLLQDRQWVNFLAQNTR